MSGRYLITGLPRSRTAWFAVATSGPESACFHEPTPHLDSFEALAEFWHSSVGISMGISDSSLAFQIERILDELGPRTLIIERPKADVIRSFENYWQQSSRESRAYYSRYCDLALAWLDYAKHHELCRSVPYDALDDFETVVACLEWLLPDEEFPDIRQLMRLNIQSRRDYNAALANAPHNGWHLPDELKVISRAPLPQNL